MSFDHIRVQLYYYLKKNMLMNLKIDWGFFWFNLKSTHMHSKLHILLHKIQHWNHLYQNILVKNSMFHLSWLNRCQCMDYYEIEQQKIGSLKIYAFKFFLKINDLKRYHTIRTLELCS